MGIALVFALSAGLFVALPVSAAPPGEQKTPVAVSWTIVPKSRVIVENYTTPGNISHIIITLRLDVDMFVGDSSTPIEGTAEVYRDTDYRYKKQGGVDQIIRDSYVFSFPGEGGGFEGQSQSILTDYVSSTNYNIRVHVLLHGSGAFKGQTLNAWQSGAGATPLWEGYLLKS